MTEDNTIDDAATLDPPGSIAVVGAGLLGIEAALYGRYLGYDVTLFEAVAVASSLVADGDLPVPMMPNRCVSPLGRSALDAQVGDSPQHALPMLVGEWIDRVWQPLTETDLLRGRLRCPATLTKIEWVAAESEEDLDEGVPPDFRLIFAGGETADFEAVILAAGEASAEIHRSLPGSEDSESIDYLFEIRPGKTGDAELDFLRGLKEIVAVYASLGGRSDLDLYQPHRDGPHRDGPHRDGFTQ